MAYNSTIQKKKCKCQECTDNPDKAKWPTFSCFGYYYDHLPENLKEKAGTKRKAQMKKSNNRKSQMLKLKKVQNEVDGSDKWKGGLWFSARRFEMTGKCLLCGEPTVKDFPYPVYKNSIAHLFQKAYFKSIKWHEENFIELCFYGKSHHTNFDNRILTLEMIKEKYSEAWKEIIRKTKILYPLMTNSEQGRVPQILINEL